MVKLWARIQWIKLLECRKRVLEGKRLRILGNEIYVNGLIDKHTNKLKEELHAQTGELAKEVDKWLRRS